MYICSICETEFRIENRIFYYSSDFWGAKVFIFIVK